MYTFQASEPDSLPPPVSFSPPNAPPISAPEVPMFTLAIPQSDPAEDKNASDYFKSFVIIAEDKPWGTAFCKAIAFSSPPVYFIKYKIGANVSC